MTSLHPSYIPVFQDKEEDLHACWLSEEVYHEKDMICDNNFVKPRWIHKDKIEAYVALISRLEGLNEEEKINYLNQIK